MGELGTDIDDQIHPQSPTPFGKPMREHFLLDKDYTNINHGKFQPSHYLLPS